MTSYTKPFIVSGALVVAGAFLAIFLYKFGLGCLIAAIGISIGAVHEVSTTNFKKFPTRDHGHKDIRYLLGDLTPEEQKELYQADRDNYNTNMSAAAFWTGEDTYIDYDGNKAYVAWKRD